MASSSASERRYTERFQRLFRQHRTTCGNSIDAFARSVNPRAVGMVDRNDFYAPVRFSIQLGASLSDPAGAVRIDQHVSGDWVAELKGNALRMAGMEPTAATLARTELRTMTGRPLDRSTVRRPEAVGRLRLFVGGQQVKIAAVPTPPPELSTTKRRDIERALVAALRTLPDVLARELDTKDVVGVNRALQPGDAVERAIGAHLSKVAGGVTWPEFVRRHHTQPRLASADARLAQGALDYAKRAILGNVRSMLRRAEDSITRYIAAQEMQAIGGDSAAAPVLGSKRIDPVTANVASGRQLYARLIDDALSPDAAPALLQRLVDAVHEYRPDAGRIVSTSTARGGGGGKPELAHRVDRAHHPVHAMVHATLMPVRGSYPAAHMARLMARQDVSAEAPYRGDADRTHMAFHLLAGLGSVPPPLIVRNGVPQPIAHHLPRHHHHRGKHDKDDGDEKKRRGRAFMESGMPALVDPPKAPVAVAVTAPAAAKRAPPTIPIAAYDDAADDYGDMAAVEPVRFPYTGGGGGGATTTLAAIQAEMRARLVPVNADAPADDVDDQLLPPVNDVYT